jgi:hypothetical protein
MFPRRDDRIGILYLFYREDLLSRNLPGNSDQPVRGIDGRIDKASKNNDEATIGNVVILRFILTVQGLLKHLHPCFLFLCFT